MDKVLADLLTRQRAALKAEALALTATADKETEGKLTAEQDVRFKAIEGDIATIDAQIAASQTSAETPEQISARLRNEMAEVTAACALAGQPERATEFIKAGTKLSDVVSTLQASRVKGDDLNNRSPGKTGKQADAAEIEAGWSSAVDKVHSQFGFKR
ncbi:MAG: hypothetical protein EOQ52_20485 [Mesorhizobium sp.]|uniref:hypothetical protein n=1 Tax=Mesorhizobium sp. TaxID=1871066 RepID=UPI000FEAA000|nr:hypothetical protein [Mesorhizobium sp.]RWB85930.1 MAG: hypothetical protein EOQ52_20485 [Mesorhizobium sp.]